MQFLHNASLSGSIPLQQQPGEDATVKLHTEKTSRKSKSHASILSPLVRLVRDPAGSLETVMESFWVTDEMVVVERNKAEELLNRKQILQQRMEEVSVRWSWRVSESNDGIGT
jgi:hypothetical protein